MNEIVYTPIGIIHSPFERPEGTPIQSAASSDTEGTVELREEYIEGLEDLGGFSHICLIYHFHMSRKPKMRQKPYMDDRERGVFATRSPSRPNSIGLSIVELVEIKGSMIRIKGVDIVDGTPLLDIKPYVPRFDDRDNVKIGWLASKIGKLKDTTDDGRFTGG
jgi:tRNA-Thr(GGU) m(6)t(6)A37 methyltransferase TsaA